jgi:hypothetical protein
VEDWELKAAGSAEKKIDSWFVLEPGRYDVEVYVDGELLSTGAFEVDESETLTVAPPSTASPSAPVSVGPLLFSDDFANNNHGWWTGTFDENGNAENEGKIMNGEYSIVTHVKDSSWRVTCEACGNFDNFYYEVNTRYVRGSTDSGYGLVFRADKKKHNLYLFAISADGTYMIKKAVDEKYNTLVNWTKSATIRPNGTNRLGILARGNSLEFFINGQSVQRLSDTSLTKGFIGLSVGDTDLEVAFSQVRVWQVQ